MDRIKINHPVPAMFGEKKIGQLVDVRIDGDALYGTVVVEANFFQSMLGRSMAAVYRENFIGIITTPGMRDVDTVLADDTVLE